MNRNTWRLRRSEILRGVIASALAIGLASAIAAPDLPELPSSPPKDLFQPSGKVDFQSTKPTPRPPKGTPKQGPHASAGVDLGPAGADEQVNVATDSVTPAVPQVKFKPVAGSAPKVPAPLKAGMEPSIPPDVAAKIRPKEAAIQPSAPQQDDAEGSSRILPNTGGVKIIKAPAPPVVGGYMGQDGKFVPTVPVNQNVEASLPGVPNQPGAITPAGKAQLPGNLQFPNFKQPASANPMPGLGTPPTAQVPGKPFVIHATPGVNEVAMVSDKYPNRIATSFANPQVIDLSGAQIQSMGGSIYFVPKDSSPAAIFITDEPTAKVPNPPTVSLTLVPKPIPAQTIIVQLDSASLHGPGMGGVEEEKLGQTYVDQIRGTMRQIVRGVTPSGYTEENLTSVPAATVGQLRIYPEKRFSGTRTDIFRYRIENIANNAIELTEQSFYQRGVRAVAFFPNIRLERKQATKVYIIADKASGEQ